MNLILFDDPGLKQNLLPLTFTRPIADLRVGILTIKEKWALYSGKATISYLTESYLNTQFPFDPQEENIFINGALIPDQAVANSVFNLPSETCLMHGDTLIAVKTAAKTLKAPESYTSKIEVEGEIKMLDQVWKIFQLNGEAIRADFKSLTKGRKSAEVNDPHTIVYGKENLFVEENVNFKAAIINADNGPVYIGRNVQIQEGAILRGPLAICHDSHINMGAKLRGDNTIGPHCKVGGEVSNTIFQGYSNKAHDGFIGNSVIGHWCNLGADTNTSNLKNNYTPIKVWDYGKEQFINTWLTFFGLIMGDHAKCGINTMFNSGTIVGVGANIFGAGYPRTMIPSFAWGGTEGFSTFKLEKMLEVAEAVMNRKSEKIKDTDKEIIRHIFNETARYRVWEKEK